MLVGAALGVLAAAAGCGSSGSGRPGPRPSGASVTSPAVVADPGPVCAGDPAPAGGLHILRGGGAALPGGRRVTYASAAADGRSRTAVLVEDGHRTTVAPGREVTLGGGVYTVAEICSYRVVLTVPGKNLTEREKHMDTWPTTVDGSWTLRWHVPDTGPDMSVVANNFTADPASCSIGVAADKQYLAAYDGLRVGDRVEIAGRIWEVASIDAGNMDVPIDSKDFQPGVVRLRDAGPA